MMIALPNPDRSFTCTLFWPCDGPDGFAGLDDPTAVRARFARALPRRRAADAAPGGGVRARTRSARWSPIRFWPWVHGGRVALLGDAAHAIVPFYGQGMNAAFEDCVELDRCLEEPPAATGPRRSQRYARAPQAEHRRHRRPRAGRTSSRCATAWRRPCSGPRSTSSTRWSGSCPGTTSRSTSSSRSAPCRTPRRGRRARRQRLAAVAGGAALAAGALAAVGGDDRGR